MSEMREEYKSVSNECGCTERINLVAQGIVVRNRGGLGKTCETTADAENTVDQDGLWRGEIFELECDQAEKVEDEEIED